MTLIKLNPLKDTLLKITAEQVFNTFGVENEEPVKAFRIGDEVKFCIVVSGSLMANVIHSITFQAFMQDLQPA